MHRRAAPDSRRAARRGPGAVGGRSRGRLDLKGQAMRGGGSVDAPCPEIPAALTGGWASRWSPGRLSSPQARSWPGRSWRKGPTSSPFPSVGRSPARTAPGACPCGGRRGSLSQETLRRRPVEPPRTAARSALPGEPRVLRTLASKAASRSITGAALGLGRLDGDRPPLTDDGRPKGKLARPHHGVPEQRVGPLGSRAGLRDGRGKGVGTLEGDGIDLGKVDERRDADRLGPPGRPRRGRAELVRWPAGRLDDPPGGPVRKPMGAAARPDPTGARHRREPGGRQDRMVVGARVGRGAGGGLRGDGGRLRLRSRADRDGTYAYPEPQGLATALGSRQTVLDGEIVAFHAAGGPSLEALQPRMNLLDVARARRVARTTPVSSSSPAWARCCAR